MLRLGYLASCPRRDGAWIGTSHETPSPSIRGTVIHRSEQGLFERCLVPAGLQWQPRVELVGIHSSQVVPEVAEAGRFTLPVTMCPEPSGRDISSIDLHVHLDRLLNHRPSAASVAHGGEAPGLRAGARYRSRAGPAPQPEDPECQAPSRFGGGSPR